MDTLFFYNLQFHKFLAFASKTLVKLVTGTRVMAGTKLIPRSRILVQRKFPKREPRVGGTNIRVLREIRHRLDGEDNIPRVNH